MLYLYLGICLVPFVFVNVYPGCVFVFVNVFGDCVMYLIDTNRYYLYFLVVYLFL